MQANQMLEMREQMLAFDAMMQGRFKDECDRLQQLIGEWDARSSIGNREQDLRVREELLAKGKREHTDEKTAWAANVEATATSQAKRQADLDAAYAKLKTDRETGQAELATVSKAKADFAAEQSKGRNDLQEAQRNMDIANADLQARKEELDRREAAVRKAVAAIGAIQSATA